MIVNILYGTRIKDFKNLVKMFYKQLIKIYQPEELVCENYSIGAERNFMKEQIYEVINEIISKYDLILFHIDYILDKNRPNDTPEYVVGTYSGKFDSSKMICLDKMPEYPSFLRTMFGVNPIDIKLYLV